MKRLFVFFMLIIFGFSATLFTGCGGSQKINGVADEESEVMQEASEAANDELPTTYLVEKGDQLWTIAAKAEIYGNKDQWPLIYDANRDILDSYENIEEGQKLIIPRNVSAVEIEAAKERAEELGVPGSGGGTAVASASSGEESDDSGYLSSDTSYEDNSDTEEDVIVAGLDQNETKMESDSAGIENEVEKNSGSSDSMGGYEEEEEMMPTPIPEPARAKKKSGSKLPIILIAVLVLAAAAGGFVMLQKKKKEEEEEEDKGDDAGILT